MTGTPEFSVPLGKGPGVLGWDYAAPGTSGLPLLSTGAAGNPAFGALALDGPGLSGQLPAASISGLAAIATSGSADDLASGTVPLARIPSLPASQIGSGTFAAARLPLPGASSIGGVESGVASLGQYMTGISTAGAPTFAAFPLGYVNIVLLGADPTGVNPCDAAWTAALALLGSSGGAIYFPAGTYSFSANISKTFPNSRYELTLVGDGANLSLLHWAGGGGLTLTAGGYENTFHIRNLGFITDSVNTGNAIHLIGFGSNNGQFFQSDVSHVTVRGSDLVPGGSSYYWAVGVLMHNWGAILLEDVNTYGPWQSPGSAGGGVGAKFEGDAASSSYATLLNVISCSFNLHNIGFELGSYWQGVTLYGVNVNGAVGSAAVYIPSSQTGVLSLLCITACQFNSGGTEQVGLNTAVANCQLVGNTITIPTNSGSGVNITGGSGLIAVGNHFDLYGTPTTTYGIAYSGAAGIIVGNYFQNIATGVNLESGSSGVNVQANSYVGYTTKVIDNGTGNSVGVATE